MSIPEKFLVDADKMPKVLRSLLESELAAGNEIAEVSHCFPAPPAGACFKLAHAVTTRERASGGGIDFYDRNSSSYSGEFTDARRFYFIIEPPNSPPPESDMDAIRAAHAPKPFLIGDKPPSPGKSSTSAASMANLHPDPLPPTEPAEPETALGRFQSSMMQTYEKWHDGIGYDLTILKTATPEERVQIENLLVTRGVKEWRDVEALGALDSPRARAVLRNAFKSGNHQISTAVITYAPHVLSEDERTAALVTALERSRIYDGLSQALLEVEEFHPPQVIEALFRGLKTCDGETAVHFAAMLMFLHGKTKSSFDWDLRPFFLKFNTDNRAQRMALYDELCEKIGVK